MGKKPSLARNKALKRKVQVTGASGGQGSYALYWQAPSSNRHGRYYTMEAGDGEEYNTDDEPCAPIQEASTAKRARITTAAMSHVRPCPPVIAFEDYCMLAPSLPQLGSATPIGMALLHALFLLADDMDDGSEEATDPFSKKKPAAMRAKAFEQMSNMMSVQQQADHALAREIQQAWVGGLSTLLYNCACTD